MRKKEDKEALERTLMKELRGDKKVSGSLTRNLKYNANFEFILSLFLNQLSIF